jgi:Na+/H+-dicarboxylate symporter
MNSQNYSPKVQYRAWQATDTLCWRMINRIRGKLWAQVLVAMVLGVGVGLILAPTGLGMLSKEAVERVAPWIALPGNLFLALIKLVVIPLVLSSIILGMASSPDPEFLKKAAVRIFPYFIGTTIAAIAIGMMLALALRPGKYIDSALIKAAMAGSESAPAPVASNEMHVADRIVALIPASYLRSVLERDMLATVVVAVIIGLAMAAATAEARQTLMRFFGAVQEVSLVVVGWAMRIAALAVFALLCAITMRVGFGAIAGMAAYVLTVLLGLVIVMIMYLVIVTQFGRMRVGEFMRGIREVQLLAFSTSSSAAVMPISMDAAENKLHVQPPIVRFVIPLGATINMDGTALYQVTAAIFLTQVFGIHLTVPALIGLALTTVGASIGTPSTPGVGIVVLASILSGVGVPASGIALIIGVDRILDMSRTAINVTGDLTACVVMDRWLKTTAQDGAKSGSTMVVRDDRSSAEAPVAVLER